MELAKIILKLYVSLIVDSEKSYYDMIKEKIDYPTYIELAQKTNEFISDDINKKMINELIKDAQQTLEEKSILKKCQRKMIRFKC